MHKEDALRKKLFAVLFFLLGLTCTQGFAALACPSYEPPPLGLEFNQASCVLVGHFVNARDNATGRSTDFIIDRVLKSHDFLKGPKVRKVKGKLVITLPNRFENAKGQFIIFSDFFKGEIEPYRGAEVQKGSELIQYLKGAAARQDAPPAQRLNYFFKYLDSKDSGVAADAFLEFSRAEFKDYKKMAKKLPAEKLAIWLQDPNTNSQQLGLYASLLGLCGKPEHGPLLRKLIEDHKNDYSLDKMLVGYVNLQPREGWKVISDLFRDKDQEFLLRYAGLRAVRTLWDDRPDILPKQNLVNALTLLLDHTDMADFAIEDLRKWKRWEMTDRILALSGQKSHEAKVIQRAILRLALASPLTSAADFVRAQRSRDPEWVRDTEELLKLE
jgi:hypothetical protein